LIIERDDDEGGRNLYSLVLGSTELVPEVLAERNQGGGEISPDGRWLAYHAETTDSWEVIVRPTSGGDRRWQVDRSGGVYPFWSPDGTSLYYIEFSGEISKVPVDGSGSTFRAGAPKIAARVAPPQPGGRYVSLHPDGERILHIGGQVSQDENGYLNLVTGWPRGLAAR
jgi:Tol biopolymer transport system component